MIVGIPKEIKDNEIRTTSLEPFDISKQVGDEIGISTYATVVLGRSAASSDQTQRAILAPVTSLNADGWYFAYPSLPPRPAVHFFSCGQLLIIPLPLKIAIGAIGT